MSDSAVNGAVPDAGQPITTKSADKAAKTWRVAVSIVLVTLTAAIGSISILLLSGIISQSRLSSIAVNGSNLSIWKLSYVGEQWAHVRMQREANLRVQFSLEQDRDFFSRNAVAAQAVWRSEWARVGPLLDVVRARLGTERPDLVVQQPEAATEIIVKILAIRAEITEKYPDIDSVLKSIEERFEAFRQANESLLQIGNTSRWHLLRIAAIKDDISSKDKELSEIIARFASAGAPDKEPVDSPTMMRIENAFYELHSSGLGSYLWNRVLTTQPDMLTLFLVLAMGILGSSLQVTHAAFKSEKTPQFSAYFIRLLVGALTALIIFIVAKAGVPIIADAGGLGASGTINPYFVSFVAIISGLLSENAIANIQAQGARIFGNAGDGEPTRWTRRDLIKEAEDKGLNLKEIAAIFGDTESQTENKLKGVSGMTVAQQRVVALVMGADRRDLFTDLPPTPA